LQSIAILISVADKLLVRLNLQMLPAW